MSKDVSREILYNAVLHPLTFQENISEWERWNPVFCKVTVTRKLIEDDPTPHDCLSITGVIRPTPSGNAYSCGQIEDSIRRILLPESQANVQLIKPWTRKMVEELLDIWKVWHLNDMRPSCEHQEQLWNLQETCHFDIYKWTNESYSRWHRLREDSLKKLECGEQVQWTPDDVLFMSLDSEVHVPSEPSLANEKEKKLAWQAGILNTYYKYVEHISKAAGWVHEKEHPFGILGKPCPVCGYGYGTRWQYRPIPEKTMETLKNFPISQVKPAWI